MARSATALFECSACGWRSAKWAGRCGECGEWGTVAEGAGDELGRASSRAQLRAVQPSTAAVPIGRVDAAAARARPTGMSELDRVLGGGLVPGAVVLLAGEPGVGKSTLLLEAGALAATADRVLYVTGEESAAQVRLRADRIGAVSDSLYLAAETDFAALLGHVQAVDPALLIVDSVQTISAAGVDGVPGGVTQVREITAALTALAKQRTLTTVLVGHVTKDGSVAGPRTLEHLVDVVLHFDGDSRGQLRMVRALKNRFGPTDEFGCFELGESGLVGLPDPSGLFLSQRHDTVPGTCVTVTLEGRRPLLAEVQALVGPVAADLPPRRVVSGLDSARVGMMLAVLQRRARLQIGRRDVFAATVGGVRLTEPSVDLAVGLAAASALADISVPSDLVAIGEIGLAGEIRRVTGIRRRLAEAERMGFKRAIIPAGSNLTAPAAPATHGAANGGVTNGAVTNGAVTNGAVTNGRGTNGRLTSSRGTTSSVANGSTADGGSSRLREIDATGGAQLEITEVTDIRGAITAALGLRGSGGVTLTADREDRSWLDCP